MTNSAVANDVPYIRASDVVATDMDGETVMMDVNDGSYFALTGSGPLIWEKLEKPMQINELLTALGEEYDTDGVDDLEGLVRDFVSKLLEKGLLKPAG
ncbi:MAG: PqqD family peptide modification chaperone [Pseudomonadota bacterium]